MTDNTDVKNCYTCRWHAAGYLSPMPPEVCRKCEFNPPLHGVPSNWAAADTPQDPVAKRQHEHGEVRIENKPLFLSNGLRATAGDVMDGVVYVVKFINNVAIVQESKSPSPYYASLQPLVDKASRLDSIRTSIRLLDDSIRTSIRLLDDTRSHATIYIGTDAIDVPDAAVLDALRAVEARLVAELTQAGIDCTEITEKKAGKSFKKVKGVKTGLGNTIDDIVED